ncbi:MAG: hypothetical protein BWZ10_01294 [candidate division BRC1 bacterium ADurb.BinA364]|nr:MAG: hypothetical protein BWZ10_01294 [candidate division BRC1 bacterium ADurb.BinA364]
MIHRSRIVGALLAAILLAVAGRAFSAQPAANSVLSDAVAFAYAPDLGALFQRLEANRGAQAVLSIFESPALLGDPDIDAFLRAKQELEQELGFSVSPLFLGTNVIKSVAFSVAMPKPAAAQSEAAAPAAPQVPTILAALEIKDAERFDALLDFFIRKSVEQGGAEPETIERNNAEISVFGAGGAQPAYATRLAGQFAFSNDRAVIEQIIDGSGPLLGLPPGADAMAQLSGSPKDLSAYIRFDVLLKALLAFAGADPETQAAIPAFQLFEGYRAAALSLAAGENEFVFESALTMDSASTNPTIRLAQAAPGSIGILGYAPMSAWAVSCANNFDMRAIFDSMKQVAQADPAGASEFESGLAMIEQAMGVSFQNDVFPAFGSEILLAVNAISPNMLMPQASTIDLTLGIQLADAEKARQLMAKVETALQGALGGFAAAPTATEGAQSAPPEELFQSQSYKGAEIRYCSLPMAPAFSPGYAIDGGYLLINTTLENLRAAVDCQREAQPSASRHPSLEDLSLRFGHENSNKIALVEIRAIVEKIKELAMPYLSEAAVASAESQVAINLLNALSAFDRLAASTRWNGKAVHSVAVVACE